MPGRTEACSSSSVRPTSRPAVRMPASCSGVLPSQRSRLNRPMPRNPTGARPPPPHPPTPSAAHAEVRSRAAISACGPNFCVPLSTASARSGVPGSATARWPDGRSARALVRGPGRCGVERRMPRGWASAPVQPRRPRALRSARAGPARGLRAARRPTSAADPESATACARRPSCARGHARRREPPRCAAAAGVDTYDVDLGDRRPGRRRERDARPQRRSAPIRRGRRLVEAGRTAGAWCGFPIALCQVAGGSGVVAAVCSMDDALHDRRCTVGQLRRGRRRSCRSTTATPPSGPSHLTDPACESVGETRTRLMLRDLGFASRASRRCCRGRRFVGRVDFLVEGARRRGVRRAGQVRGAGGPGRPGRREGARVGHRRPGLRGGAARVGRPGEPGRGGPSHPRPARPRARPSRRSQPRRLDWLAHAEVRRARSNCCVPAELLRAGVR